MRNSIMRKKLKPSYSKEIKKDIYLQCPLFPVNMLLLLKDVYGIVVNTHTISGNNE